ncbi:hypothetical protein [Devosia ginsengisoli]|uniref:hypothetical protein n=1 Tax=Devosia ginsengisoli TaxID=400770 RepID=UPI0026EDC398|nr:hypothetical protein [Devosia ginsengisoli]MCR6656549.1 hypothetical protein [Opitutus sp.]MCR6670988.1 hypothetical protein [Devosia ginsengisoli]
MTPHTTQPSFGQTPQDQPAPQAAPVSAHPARPRKKSLPRVTHALAARHEALWLRLSALQAQITAVATRRPEAPVSRHTSGVAEALLRDARPFLAHDDPLPMAAPDHGGLATQLGQALAELDGWEAANSVWRSDLKAYVWLVKDKVPLPVRRLRPRLETPQASHADPKYAAYQAKMLDLRQKLAKRIEQYRNR